MKLFLQNNNIEMYLTHNEGKSVIAEIFIKTFKNEIYKYMTSISRNVHINKLDDIFNKYNNANHKTVKMNSVDVKQNACINSSKEINDKGSKLKIGDIVRISKNKNMFAKIYIPNWSEEIFVIKKYKNTVPWT